MAEDPQPALNVRSPLGHNRKLGFWRRLRRRYWVFLLGLAEPKKLIGLGILLTLLIWAWVEATRDVVTLNSFSAPRGLDDRGLSGLYVTSLVADHIAVLESSSYNVNQHRFQPASSESLPEVEIPETKISLKSIFQFVRNIIPERFIRGITIEGDMALEGTDVSVVVRIRRSRQVSAVSMGPFSWPLSDSKATTEAIEKIAQEIVKEIDPVTMANYFYFTDEKPDRALEFARTSLAADPASAADLELFVGSVLMDQGDLNAAKAKYQSVLERYPNHAGALNLLGRYYELIEDSTKALSYYQDALSANKDSPEVLNNLAYRYLDYGDLPQALSHFHQALEVNPDYSWAYRGIAYVYDSAGATDMALTALRKGIASSRNDSDREAAYEAMGTYLANKDSGRQALLYLDAAVKLNPTSPIAFQERGRALLIVGDVEGAKREYERALSIAINRAEVLRQWAGALASKQMYAAAFDKYARAHDEDPYSVSVLTEWGRLLLSIGDEKQGQTRFSEALAASSYRAAILKHWGEAYRDSGNNRDAIERLRAAERQRVDPLIYSSLAESEYNSHKYVEADRDYEKAANLSTYPSGVLRDYGNRLAEQGRLDRAIGVFERSIEEDPRNDSAQTGLGLALIRTGRQPEAANVFRAAIATVIYPPAVYQAWADAEAGYGRHREAIAYLKDALSLDPNDVDARVSLARNLFALGQNSTAEHELSRAASVSVTPWIVHQTWGDLLLGKRDFTRAEEHFRLAVTEAPFLVSAHDGLVRTLKAQGKPEEALKAAAEAVRASPFDPGAYYVLANYLRSVEKTKDAISEYDVIAAHFPTISEPLIAKGELLLLSKQADEGRRSFELGLRRGVITSEMYVRCGAAFSSAGQFGHALEFYDRALESDPNFVTALRGKAEVLGKLGRIPEASRLFQEAIDVGVDLANSYDRWGQSLTAREDYAAGLKKYDEGLRHEPTNIDLYIGKAAVSLQKGDNANALHILWFAQGLGLNSPELQHWLAVASCREETFSAANGYFQQAENDSPGSSGILFDFADCLSRQKNPQANEKYRRSLDSDVEFLPYYGNANRTPWDDKDIQGAIDGLREKASVLDPDVQSKVQNRIARLQQMVKP